MIVKDEKAILNFTSGFNCAQAVLSVFCEAYDLDIKTALKLTSGLGGGFRAGEICGAISGAVLVIGLKYGQDDAEDIETKRNCYNKTIEYISEYRKRYGELRCRDILGYDVTSEEDRIQIKEKNLFQLICEEQIRNAISLLEELGY